MPPEASDKEWQNRFAEIARSYRAAFRAVQRQLRATDMGRIPAWCFAIDRMEIAEIAALDPNLAAAERERRQWRVALHSLAEYIALQADAASLDQQGSATGSEQALLDSIGGDGDAELDRFITVLNYARTGGVIYVNGSFEPVVGGTHSQPPQAARESNSEG